MDFQSLREEDVGITEFTGKEGQQIKCVLKHRYTDFLVFEIEQNMNVLEPNIQEIQRIEQARKAFNEMGKQSRKEKNQSKKEREQIKDLDQKAKEILTNEFSEEFVENIIKIIDDYNCGLKDFSKYKQEYLISDDKQIRKQKHEIIRKFIPDFDSTTGDITYFKIIPPGASNNKKRKFRDDNTQKKSFLKFTLMKQNIDTMNIINMLSKQLYVKGKRFSYAGIKDKRGVTTQKICFFEGEKELFENLQTRRSIDPNTFFYDFEIVSDQLRLGDLYGNKFVIHLRFLSVSDPQILQQNISTLEQFGFINYYGLQRFGQSNIHTHEIGKEILSSNWQKAFEMIISQTVKDDKINQVKQEFIKSYNFSETLSKLTPRYRLERILIDTLQKLGGKDFLGCLQSLSRGMRDLYPHAYQSYIWNKGVSQRIKKYGLQVVIGDLVLKDKKIQQSIQEETKQEETEEILENLQNLEEIEEILPEDLAQADITVVDETNIKNYTLQDIVFPIFGTENKFPQNTNAYEIYQEIFKEEGLELTHFQKVSKQFFLKGNYRNIFVKPKDFKWQVVHFSDLESEVLDPLAQQNNFTSSKLQSDQSGPISGLILSFSLQKSSYATMLIREVTKFSTTLRDQVDWFNEFKSSLK